MSPSVCVRSLLVVTVMITKGAAIRILEGGGLEFFLEINIFVEKMGEINKLPQDMVEMNIFPTQ